MFYYGKHQASRVKHKADETSVKDYLKDNSLIEKQYSDGNIWDIVRLITATAADSSRQRPLSSLIWMAIYQIPSLLILHQGFISVQMERW